MTDNSTSDREVATAAHVQAFCLAFISIVGSSGNIIILIAMGKTSKLRNSTNIFIGSLALSDLFNCLTLPWNIVAIVSVNHWPSSLPEGICVMSSLVLISCTVSSFYSLACVAYVRYVIVTKSSAKTEKYVNFKIAAILISSTWGISLVTAILPVVFNIVTLGYDAKYNICLWDMTTSGHVIYSTIFAAVLIPVPLFSMTYFYAAIYIFISKEAEKSTINRSNLNLTAVGQNSCSAINVRKRNIDVTKNLFVVVLAFIICAVPHSFAIIIPGTANIIPYTAIIFNCSSCINPMIYARKLPEYRRVISRMFGIYPDAVHDISVS